ncbi:MAG TPA: peptidoglycan editing factor PgeF [Candidatus Faecousia intestinigallinarum]|nr:peptidoglycan editing factor PgeF [Candidatus Faecousia intestinigallinarum]
MAVVTERRGGLVYQSAQGISAPHCFTTRLGGVSRGYLASLNIGFTRGDDRENVLENYRILGQALGFAPEQVVCTRQTHTDIVRMVTKADMGTGVTRPAFPDCDALVTKDAGVVLTVFTADCTPILLHDPVTGTVGAVHAGWRGTAADIVGKTVAAMAALGSRRADICAAIGPNIGQCCFETDGDVPEAIRKTLGEAAEDYIRAQGDKYYVNLKGVNAWLLRRAGVGHIEVSELCTACRTDLFWSHRRMGAQRGSQGALILCEGSVEA